MQNAQGCKNGADKNIAAPKPKRKSVKQVATKYETNDAMQEDTANETNPTDVYGILQNAGVRPLLLRVMRNKVSEKCIQKYSTTLCMQNEKGVMKTSELRTNDLIHTQM